MYLYFDTKVQFPETGTISTSCVWHSKSPMLAVASYSQEKGGFVTIFDELGEPLQDISYPVHPVSQVTALAWHPDKNTLVTGWENGEIRVWNGSGASRDFIHVNGPHSAPVNLLAFSEQGGRLVSGDTTGSLVGWKCDGNANFLTSFHHDLKEPITHLTFRLSVLSKASAELETLARAAVNGDETALDALSSWRPRTTARTSLPVNTKDNLCFYVGTQAGILYYVNQSGSCLEVMNTEGSAMTYLLYHPSQDSLVVMMEGLNIGHYSVDTSGGLTEVSRVKLSGKTQALRGANSQGLVWVGSGALAILTGDMTVRIWDFDIGDNYLLPTELLMENYSSKANTELFTSIAYCNLNRTLCAGTNLGQLYIWTYKNVTKINRLDNPEDNWTLNNINSIKGTVKQIDWGSVNQRNPMLAVNCITNVYVLKKQSLCSFYCDDLWATQLGSSQILIQNNNCSLTLNSDIQVLCLCLNKNYVILSNGRTVVVYTLVMSTSNDVKTLGFKVTSSFPCDSEKLLIYEQTVLVLMQNGIQLRSLSGIILSIIQFNDSEGEPIGMDLTNKYLTIFTMNGYLKIYDISKHEPKMITHPKNVYDMLDDFGEVISAKCNNDGTHVALTVASSNLIPNGMLYLWNIEMDSVGHYDFINEDVGNDNQFGMEWQDDQQSTKNDEQNHHILKSIPVAFYWDTHDPRLLACETRMLKTDTSHTDTTRPNRSGTTRPGSSTTYTHSKETTGDVLMSDSCITSLFTSETGGLVVLDRCWDPLGSLLALSTPHVIVQGPRDLIRTPLRHFVGLENCDAAVRNAVLDFSYHLSAGNMDQAFKAIKSIQSKAIWSNLANMCIKTRRLDAALVCLGHLGNARSARALRQAMEDLSLEPEAKVAVLAVQLGELNDAEALYKSCKRWDLLNKLYQARGKFGQAINVAETGDRIHLRNTYFQYGQYKERSHDVPAAIELYQKAQCNNQIPGLLMDNPTALKNFMEKTTDPEMLKWWAQYSESRGDVNGALCIYEKADDYVSQVRVLCFMGLESRAAEVARASNNKAACYELARHYEAMDNIDEAIQFFRRAQAYSMAMRICRERGLDEALWGIAGAASHAHKAEAAEYFEAMRDMQKAVSLYHRAGLIHKALELAFSSQQFDVLQDIATDLDTSTDPELIAECAEYFSNNDQFERAVDLLAIAKKYTEALDICTSHSVNLSESLTERLSPAKGTLSDTERAAVLYRLAEVLHAQGDYHLATKKFTQAGDKVRAMKSLLKSGDTDKIIFFAGVSRQREVYVMAANYLQALDWQSNPEILRNIVSFYAKGRAHNLLANFYVACAQVEIDEYQNYEKALGALGEAGRCLAKATPEQRLIESLAHRQALVKRFLDCQRIIERDLNGGLMQCRQLLQAPDADNPVRKADVYSLMINNCVKKEEFLQAKGLLGDLRAIVPPGGIGYYVPPDVMGALARALGMSLEALNPTPKSGFDNEDGDEILEMI